jgi:DNA-binding CsgD family transcriptional regulator
MATFRRSRGRPPSEGLFTPSEERVLELIRLGKTNSEIANELRISVAGVKYHVTNLLGKTGVRDRAALAEWDNGHERRFSVGWTWPIVFAGSGAAAVLVVAVALAAFAMNGGDDAPAVVADDEPTALPTSTPTPRLQITPTPLKPQPPLREAASGNGWRLLLADDGLGLPPVAERVLAVAYDGPEQRVDVLGADGRIAARVETGHGPMARVNPITGELLVSDSAGPTPEFQRRHERLLVFGLPDAALRAEVPFEQDRVDFTVPHSAVWVSEDGRFFYWIEHGHVCPSGGDGEVCDLHIFHAIDLQTFQATAYAAQMPTGCGVPVVADSRGSALTVVCRPPTNSTAWKIDAASPVQNRPEPSSGVRSPSWVGSSAGDSLLDVEYTGDGTLTALKVFDRRSGATLSKWPVTAYEALLLDERTALVLRSDGRLERVDLLTGVGEELPYAIDPGNQGLDIRFYR